MKTTYDCIIIGGGHNGLVTAAYLAKAGKSVSKIRKPVPKIRELLPAWEIRLPKSENGANYRNIFS